MFISTFIILLALFTLIVYAYFSASSSITSKSPTGPHRIQSQSLLDVLRTARGKVFHQALAQLQEKYGDFFAFRFGRGRIYIVSSVNHVRHILNDRNTYDISETVNRSFSLVFPSCIQAIRGDDFKRHYRIMAPLYRKGKLVAYFDQILHCIDHFIDEEFSQQGQPIYTDLVKKCQHALLNVICAIGYNYDLEQDSSSHGYKLHQAFDVMIQRSGRFDITASIPMWMARLRLSFDSEFQNAYKILKEYVMGIIEEEQKRQNECQPESQSKKTIIASMVAAAVSDRLENGTKSTSLSANELFDEVCFSIVAGFETTSTVLSWFFFLISKHLNVQNKVKEELRQHGMTPGAPLTLQTMDKLIYLECVLKETLRYAPLVAGIIRQATCDDMIDDFIVKKGDVFVIATQNIHRDSRHWKIDPNRFEPDRFLNEDKHQPPCVYMPFGGGHRACIGQELAMLILKIAIARILQRVTIEDAGTEEDNSGGFVQSITCFPKHVAVRISMDSDQTGTL